ncbi:hypothetical protein E2562_024170 [Oryza meyeriana var. granulata]|uniref:Uncharacterized protein n=1 Tax=Oryza meyeriana var. granulata TaxID=110450 RepID=A0A6G1CI28_9ORYZ|nr:hypothetical protein E2562_024170 [Oryza meyeriana var. granulata]
MVGAREYGVGAPLSKLDIFVPGPRRGREIECCIRQIEGQSVQINRTDRVLLVSASRCPAPTRKQQHRLAATGLPVSTSQARRSRLALVPAAGVHSVRLHGAAAPRRQHVCAGLPPAPVLVGMR